jgi:hypothetical protein
MFQRLFAAAARAPRAYLLAGGAAAVTASATTAACAAGSAKVDGEKVVGSTKWLQLVQLDYTDDEGVKRKWDMCQRAGNPKVVSVLPILTSKSFKPGDEETLLTCQFRPPQKAYVLELPGAIALAGESVEECATRCILDETGYNCTVRSMTKALAPSAGLTNEQYTLVVVDVNLDDYKEDDVVVTKTVASAGRKKRRRGIKKTTKKPGESWVPQQVRRAAARALCRRRACAIARFRLTRRASLELSRARHQGDLLDDQHIQINKIKLADLQKHLESAMASRRGQRSNRPMAAAPAETSERRVARLARTQAEGVVSSVMLPCVSVGIHLGKGHGELLGRGLRS